MLHQPGRNPLAGDDEGIDNMLALLRQLGERSGGTFRSEQPDRAAGRVGWREGRSMDVPAVHVWHVRDGRLAELWVHPADQYTVDELWA